MRVHNRNADGEITRVDFTADSDLKTDPDNLYCLFVHRDKRIWRATARKLTTAVHIEDAVFRWDIGFSTDGCRNYRVLATTRQFTHAAVVAFANIPNRAYQRLIADAVGTMSHPIVGTEGIARYIDAWTDSAKELKVRGRYNGHTIVVYPQSEELSQILGTYLPPGSIPLVPTGINAIDSTNEGFQLITTKPMLHRPDMLAVQLMPCRVVPEDAQRVIRKNDCDRITPKTEQNVRAVTITRKKRGDEETKT